MYKENQLYCLMLEDYFYPRTASVAKSYYGTLENMLDLSDILCENEWTFRRYHELICGLEQYDGMQEICNDVTGIAYPLLTPMTEVYRHKITLTDHNWIGIGFSGAYCSLTADCVEATQILLKTDTGYRRCMRAAFTNLRICIPNLGWVYLNGATKGFPGIVSHESETTTMSLFVDQQYYPYEDLAQAVLDAQDPERINLAAVIGDILGEI